MEKLNLAGVVAFMKLRFASGGFKYEVHHISKIDGTPLQVF
jgi:hypothetical protein